MTARTLVLTLVLAVAPPASAAWSGLTYQASTYLGGTGEDTILAVTVDATGAIYVAGRSTSADLPTTQGALQVTKPGGPFDASGFVAKLEPDGTVDWTTYLGGSLGDQVEGIAVDAAGQVLVTGTTNSSDFPTTGNAFRPVCRPDAGPATACLVGFLSVLSPDGGSLHWSTFIASADGPVGVKSHAIAVSGGLACVAGGVAVTGLPVTPDAAQALQAGSGDAFVACYDPAATGAASLVFATYFGGTGGDEAFGLAADGTGRLFAVGATSSTDLPVLNAAQPDPGGGTSDAFVLALTPGRTIAYATYFGGGNIDSAMGAAASPDGVVFFTGQTKSSDLPVRAPLQAAIGGGAYGETFGDAFVARIDPDGTLAWATYLGGFTYDWGRAVALGGDGIVHVCGATDAFDFPLLPGAPDLLPENMTGFAVGLPPDGSAVVYSTRYRALYDPHGCAAGPDLVIAGEAHAGGVDFGSPMLTYAGGAADGFLARLAPGAPGVADIAVTGVAALGRGGTLDVAITVANLGPDTATGLLLYAQNWPGATFTGGAEIGSLLGVATQFQLPDLLPGAQTVLPLNAAPGLAGPFQIVSRTLAHQTDPASANDAIGFEAVIATSHLVVATAVDPATSAQGDEVTIAADVTNQGPDPAPAVEAVIGLAGGRPGAAGFPGGCRVSAPNTATCAMGDLAVGATAHLALPVQLIISAGGPSGINVDASSLNRQGVLDGHATTDVVVAYADAVLSVAPPAGTLAAGQGAALAVTLQTTSGRYPAPWSLACASPGSGITCSIDSASLDPGAGTATGTLHVATSAPTAGAGALGFSGPNGGVPPLALAAVLALGLALLLARARLPVATAPVALAIMLGVTLGGCGGDRPSTSPGPGLGGTPPGQYTVTVTATLGSVPDGFAYGTITRTAQVTVIVH